MKVDTVITLENGKKYGILLESDILEDNYFLAVLLDDKEEPTDKYLVLKEIIKNDETFISQEKDPLILNQLLEDYKEQYAEEYEN